MILTQTWIDAKEEHCKATRSKIISLQVKIERFSSLFLTTVGLADMTMNETVGAGNYDKHYKSSLDRIIIEYPIPDRVSIEAITEARSKLSTLEGVSWVMTKESGNKCIEVEILPIYLF